MKSLLLIAALAFVPIDLRHRELHAADPGNDSITIFTAVDLKELRTMPPFRATVTDIAINRRTDGATSVMVTLTKPDKSGLRLMELKASPEAKSFAEFLRKGLAYDFPKVLIDFEKSKKP